MPDDLQIPMPGHRAPVSASYRPRPMGGGLSSRGMTIAAAGLGGVLLLGLGSWALMGRRPMVVPVIEADSRPLRVKPENAGGMQIAGADEAVMGGTISGADRMAPSAEVPAPQALRAQLQQPAAPAPQPVSEAPPVIAPTTLPSTAPAPTAALPTSPSTPSGVASGASPLPDTPARPQAAAPATAKAIPAPAVRPAAGTTLVQLAALESEAAAQAEWSRLAKRLPDLLGSRRLVVQKAERDGQAVYRVRTGGFADTAEATGFCGKVRAKGASCTVATF